MIAAPEKPKFPNAVGMKVAAELCAALKPACDRLIVAGSLRRRKPMIRDVEILYISHIAEIADGLFDIIKRPAVEGVLAHLLATGVLAMRKNINGSTMWGPQNKYAVHVASGLPVDLFATTLDNWWVSLVIRTGSKMTNLRLTNGAILRGRNLMAYGCGVACSNGTIITAESEAHVFELCGIPYLSPEQR